MSDLKQRRRRAGLSVNRLIPNAVTLLALCAGMTAIRMALQERWEMAVVAVVVAMILDSLDGRIARMMSATSDFGAQLDSLSDVINFGVAPALLVYVWALDNTGGIGWALAVVFAMCCALRLARFNTELGEENPPPWASRFFTGVPAPAGAGLVLLPMTVSFEAGAEVFRSATLNGIVLLVVAALMISRIPTFSAKRIKVPRRHVGLVLLAVGAFAAFLVSTPWVMLTCAGIAYLLSIPLAAYSFRRVQRAEPAAAEPPAPAP